MSKSLFIAEKPSVAQEFAKALKLKTQRHDGYLESENTIVTWCVGHLVTMSYPEVYDINLKRWSLETLPFLPGEFKYEVIPSVKKQFDIVKELLNRPDVTTIYVCTDSGREGEYIYRLVAQMAQVRGKQEKRVWIDSQTEEEIIRGIKEAKDLSAYDNLSDAAYLRAKEDYLMGINFSRLLSLRYGNSISNYLGNKYQAISVGRVMTCVLGMVVRREREIREFVKTPFYRVLGKFALGGKEFDGEWRAVEGSQYFQSPYLYKENGFKEREKAEELQKYLQNKSGQILEEPGMHAVLDKIEKKKEKKNPPLLYNLAELQNDCSRIFKISPDETLRVVQELYEKKLVTYPRTDARVLSTAVTKEITRNINGLLRYPPAQGFAQEILDKGSYKGLEKTRYVNDKQITDHYAIIPTGQGLGNLNRLPVVTQKVYQVIVRRFLSIFFPPAVYQKVSLVTAVDKEKMFSSFKVLIEEGYLKVANVSSRKKEDQTADDSDETASAPEEKTEDIQCDADFLEYLQNLKKGAILPVESYDIKEGETSPPKRYNSGTMILAMENAGQLIEDDELRSLIKGSGIGTSATRAEILKKLVNIKYIALNKKTQIITPTQLGEMIYEVVNASIRSLLNPELTASWEKGLNYVAEGSITSEEYMAKLEHFIRVRVSGVLQMNNQYVLRNSYDQIASNYKKGGKS
ncbi:MAG: type IA DNA topoisomerase [Clostridia bacterium]|nr:type IA DNA topoisomerase [Clostridia bacterium]NCC43731.1 type IA DNA topoisomerase [Clostridia bacterium]